VRVLDEYPHDPGAFTEGLLLAEPDVLYESTGHEGESTVRRVQLTTGQVLASVDLDAGYFGEGLALVAGRLVQLTWKAGTAFVYEEVDLSEVGAFTYEGEAWGLCLLGDQLVQSDGTDLLRFRNPVDFEVTATVEVTEEGRSLGFLNELECVDGAVWANVWQTNRIVQIDPASGRVVASVDASSLDRPAAADVLNGIAYDPADGTFLLTGKYWPTLYRVSFVPA
jgi:glutaminyl-peptide cyclotransferase